MRALEVLGCTLAVASAVAGNAAAQGGSCDSDVCDPGRTLLVNTVDDLDDGACDPEHCSLREAIGAANEDALRDTVLFAIPVVEPQIHLESPLPPIWQPLVLDGSGQPDASIESNDGGEVLRVYAGDTVIRGLTIRATGGAAIRLSYGLGSRVEGNVLMIGRFGTGVLIEDAAGLVVGGSGPGEGNRIVADPAIPNGSIGIEIRRWNRYRDHGDRIEGNEILDAEIGILAHSSDLTVGGLEPGTGNAIHGYRRAGVVVEGGFFAEDVAGHGVAILGNSMLSGGGIGIDLAFDGRTPNDTWDADQGPNGLQNSPVLTSAEAGDGMLTVAGTLHTT